LIEDTSKSDFVVDVYVQDETILPESDEFLKSTLVTLERFSEDLVLENEYDRDNDSENDSEDSNAEDHVRNDYPDEEKDLNEWARDDDDDDDLEVSEDESGGEERKSRLYRSSSSSSASSSPFSNRYDDYDYSIEDKRSSLYAYKNADEDEDEDEDDSRKILV